MLVLDVSNIINSGVHSKAVLSRAHYDDDVILYGIPYLMSKLANFTVKSEDIAFVFDPDKNGQFNGTGSFQTHRLYNPQVVWELTVLKKLLELVGADIIQSQNRSADSLIHSVLVDYNNSPEDHYIVSADQDLTCNIWDRGHYSNSFLAFNPHSYKFSKENFYQLLKIPYNFVNLHKTLRGCHSDTIPAFPSGAKILNSYYKYLEEYLDVMSFGEYNSIVDFHLDLDVGHFNTWDAFKDWLVNKSEFEINLQELEIRRKAVFPKYQPVSMDFALDWTALNSINYFLFCHTQYINQKQPFQELSKGDQSVIWDIVKGTPKIGSTVFVPNSNLEVSSDAIEGLGDFAFLDNDEEGV